jgi:hypothetical protein
MPAFFSTALPIPRHSFSPFLVWPREQRSRKGMILWMTLGYFSSHGTLTRRWASQIPERSGCTEHFAILLTLSASKMATSKAATSLTLPTLPP